MSFLTSSSLGSYGRFGNQMFQYAALYAFAKKIGCVVRLHDLSSRVWHGQKCLMVNFLLEYKPMDGHSATRQYKNYTNLKYFDTDIKPGTDVSGFFFSWRFFDFCKEDIRRQYRFREPLATKARAYIDNLKKKYNCDIVAIHVRRGDATQNGIHYNISSIDNYKGSVYEKYINEARSIIEKKVGNVKYLLFSGGARNNRNQSDIDWCKEQMNDPDFLYCCDEKGDSFDDITDFAFMASCDHFIGAQCTTYGWWATWLGQNTNKIVVVPTPHHWNPEFGNTDDYYPPEWIRVKTTDHTTEQMVLKAYNP